MAHEPPAPLARTNVTLPADLLEEVDRYARPRGRSRYVAKAVAQRVRAAIDSASDTGELENAFPIPMWETRAPLGESRRRASVLTGLGLPIRRQHRQVGAQAQAHHVTAIPVLREGSVPGAMMREQPRLAPALDGTA
jgi:hypothetical protein